MCELGRNSAAIIVHLFPEFPHLIISNEEKDGYIRFSLFSCIVEVGVGEDGSSDELDMHIAH